MNRYIYKLIHHDLIPMRLLKFWIFLLCFHGTQAQDISILDFGASPDGTTLNTFAIQSAIDSAYANGGGRIIIPDGQFLSGSIILKSNVELHLHDNAKIIGSTDPDHYIKLNRWKALVMADNQSNIAITGKGIIDGQGRQLALHIDSLFYAGKIDSSDYNFVEMRPKYYLRPQLIEFVQCKNIKVVDLTLKNAACWVQTHEKCDNILIDNVKTDSDAYWNNDGIDIQDCRNVRITNCIVNSSDDGICIKSNSDFHYCDSIYVANCTVRSSASAIKFGTKSLGAMKNVLIENIKIYDTFRSAIAIESVDGGIVENIIVRNITAVNTGNAIFIKLGNRRKKKETGVLRNILIENMRVEIAFERPDYDYEVRGPDLPFFHNTFPSSITGIPGHPVQNVTLENIEILFPGRGNNGLANMPISRLDDVPEKIKDYPEFSMFGELPAWGFYVRHVDGLQMKNVSLSIKDPDYRPSIVLDDVANAQIKELKISGDSKKDHIVIYKSRQLDIEEGHRILKL